MLLWVLAIADRPRDVAIPLLDRLALLPDILIYIPFRYVPNRAIAARSRQLR